MRIQIEAPMTLQDLRDLVNQTEKWPPKSQVQPLGSTSRAIGPATLTVTKWTISMPGDPEDAD